MWCLCEDLVDGLEEVVERRWGLEGRLEEVDVRGEESEGVEL